MLRVLLGAHDEPRVLALDGGEAVLVRADLLLLEGDFPLGVGLQ